jgi:hypothetical protein
MKKHRTEVMQWLEGMRLTGPERDEELERRCTSAHPNHEFLHPPVRGDRYFWQAWCSVCEANGCGDNTPANPEMTQEHIAAYDRRFIEN